VYPGRKLVTVRNTVSGPWQKAGYGQKYCKWTLAESWLRSEILYVYPGRTLVTVRNTVCVPWQNAGYGQKYCMCTPAESWLRSEILYVYPGRKLVTDRNQVFTRRNLYNKYMDHILLTYVKKQDVHKIHEEHNKQDRQQVHMIYL
jgi:hypothetical protein